MRVWPDKFLHIKLSYRDWFRTKEVAHSRGDLTLASYVRHLIAKDIAEAEKRLWARGEKLKEPPPPPLTQEEQDEDQKKRVEDILRRGI